MSENQNMQPNNNVPSPAPANAQPGQPTPSLSNEAFVNDADFFSSVDSWGNMVIASK